MKKNIKVIGKQFAYGVFFSIRRSYVCIHKFGSSFQRQNITQTEPANQSHTVRSTVPLS